MLYATFKTQDYHEGEFDVNAQGLMSALQPFEMQEKATVSMKF